MGDERLDPVIRLPGRQDGLQQRDQLGTVAVALRVRLEARVVHHAVLDAEDLAEAAPHRFGAYRHDDRPVPGL